MNKLYKGLIFDNQLTVAVLDTKDMVNDAVNIHGLSPVTAAALGRAMTVGAFMSSGLKNDTDKLSITIKGDGKGGRITVCGNKNLQMRGSIDNPVLDLPLKPNGKLDVSACVGKVGRLTVVKSMGLKEPYSGSCALVSGEIAEDFAAYYFYSEQQPTAIAVGVKIGKEGKCVGAGGVIVQALPGAKEENLLHAEETVKGLFNISSLLENGSAEEIIYKYFGLKEGEYEKYYPKYECLCSENTVESSLAALGKEELRDIIEKQGKIEVGCEFCKKVYVFDGEKTEEIIKKYGL